MTAWIDGQSAVLTHTSGTNFGSGYIGLYADKTGVSFDDFAFQRQLLVDPAMPGWKNNADFTVNTGGNVILIDGGTRGGVALVDDQPKENFVAEGDVALNGGTSATMFTRFQDLDTWLGARIDSGGNVSLVKMLDGVESTVDADTYTPAGSVNLRVKVNGATAIISIDGTPVITTTDMDILWGYVGFTGDTPTVANFKIGYDNNADGDISDGGDDLTVSDTFSSTSVPLNADSSDGTDDGWDRAGNMALDTRLRYVYDAWNRLVKAQSRQDSDVVIQTAEYDGLGRRIQKVVSNSGGLDGTFTFYYDSRWRMLEVRDGSANVVAQVYGGTQYIDEVVAMRVEEGYMVVNQDANWNVVSATDLAGRVLERTFYTAYGLPTFNSETYFGDYDGDGEVDSTDDGHLGSGQTCWGASPAGACRVFDLDQDGDLDNDDQTVMTALVGLASTNHVRLARTSGTTGGLFAHQGLLLDAEVGQYQNRARVYSTSRMTFAQRDPLMFINGMHLYEYEGASPLNVVDPTGLAWDPNAPRIGSDCAQRENQTGKCNILNCCYCGNNFGTFETTVECHCKEGPGPAQTTWQVKCGGGKFTVNPSGCPGQSLPKRDSEPCNCAKAQSCCDEAIKKRWD